MLAIDLIPSAILLISVAKAAWDFFLSDRFSRSDDDATVEDKLKSLKNKKKLDSRADQLAFFAITFLSAVLIVLQITSKDADALQSVNERIDALEVHTGLTDSD